MKEYNIQHVWCGSKSNTTQSNRGFFFEIKTSCCSWSWRRLALCRRPRSIGAWECLTTVRMVMAWFLTAFLHWQMVWPHFVSLPNI